MARFTHVSKAVAASQQFESFVRDQDDRLLQRIREDFGVDLTILADDALLSLIDGENLNEMTAGELIQKGAEHATSAYHTVAPHVANAASTVGSHISTGAQHVATAAAAHPAAAGAIGAGALALGAAAALRRRSKMNKLKAAAGQA